jgi:KipI family sensor histidine kinase inhibitor
VTDGQPGLRLRPAGSRALLVEVDGGAQVRGIAAWLRHSEFATDIEEVVPASTTILVRCARSVDEIADALRSASSSTPYVDEEQGAGRVEVAVDYSGEDLDEVCERVGTTRAELIEAHTAAGHTVAFFGFVPGLPYIEGVPAALQVPRRPTPRVEIGAGAVAIANGFTIIYPGGTPGGWSIIGHTTAPPLWDVDRDPPNLFAIGDRVVFRVAT